MTKEGKPRKTATQTETLTFRVSPGEKQMLATFCEETGMSQTEAVKRAIREYAKLKGVKLTNKGDSK